MNNYMISMVINKAGQHKCRIDFFKPFHAFFEIPIYIVAPQLDIAIITKCKDDIETNVTVKKWKNGIISTKKPVEPGEKEIVNGTLFEADNLTRSK